MATVTYDPCNVPPGAHTVDPNCLEEGSRIVGAIAVKVGFDIKTIIDQATFDAAVAAEDIIPVKKIAGNWPAPQRNTRPGTGLRETEFVSWTFNVPFRHTGVDANLAFWNTMNQSKDYSIVFVTEDFKAFGAFTRTDLTLIPMDISAYMVSDDELGNTRRIEGSCGWKYKDLPYVIDEIPSALLTANFNV